MKTILKVLFAVLLLIVGGVIALAIYVRNYGFSARASPSWIEEVMARNARRIVTPAGAKALKNPHAPTEAGRVEALTHFVEHCAICHGNDGRGNTKIGSNLYPKVPDMTGSETQQLTDGELFYIITNGVRFTGMPAWGNEESPESTWALVGLIRRLPLLTPEELREMQRMAEGDESKKETSAEK